MTEEIPRVTIKDCERLIKSDFSKSFIIKCFRYWFSSPKNFDTYCEFLFPDAFNSGFAAVHYKMIDFFFEEKNSAHAMPRGFGKSTLAGIGYGSYYINYNLGRYVVYTSKNHQMSMQFIEPLRKELSLNEMMIFIYGPYFIGKVQDETKNKDRGDMFDVNGIRVHALSFEKNIRGLKFGNHRPSLIFLDDIEDDQRVINPLLRIKDSDKLNRQIIPSLAPEGKIKFVGTILHFDSLLMSKIKLYDGTISKAIDNEGNSTFPSRFSLDKLAEIKRDIGSLSFQQEYMNEPVADENCIIRPEWIRACFDEELSYGQTEGLGYKTQGLDSAFSDRVEADFTALACIGVNEFRQMDSKGKIKGKYTLFHAQWEKGWSIIKQLEELKRLAKLYKIDISGIEENSIRAISEELLKDFTLNYKLFWLGSSDPQEQAKITPVSRMEFQNKRHTIGKNTLVLRLGTRFENKEIRIPYKTKADQEKSNRLLDELTSWGLQQGKLIEAGVHPDMPIALGYALELIEMQKVIFDV